MIDPLLLTVVEEDAAERGSEWIYPMIDTLLLNVAKEKAEDRG